MTEYRVHVDFTCIHEADSKEDAEAAVEATIIERLHEAGEDPWLVDLSPVSARAFADDDASRLDGDDEPSRPTLGRGQSMDHHQFVTMFLGVEWSPHGAHWQMQAARARWQGREYYWLGWGEHLDLLIDDAGLVVAVEDGYRTKIERRCDRCGRWSPDVQRDYGSKGTYEWSCAGHE